MMKSYSTLEQTVAKSFHRFPRLQTFAKVFYRRLNYYLFRERGFKIDLHPEVRLMTPAQWAGTDTNVNELFFGYYDKSPWIHDMKQAVFHCAGGNHRVEIVIYDQEQHTVRSIGRSTAWNWQQGSMAQWIRVEGRRAVIFNDVVTDQLVARIVPLNNEPERIVPWPIQVIHPTQQEALSLNYKRLDRIRPEYGYSVDVSNFSTNQRLEEDGIWRIDIETGKAELILSLAELINHRSRPEMANSEHKVNHIMYSPKGTRFVFMHRWVGQQGKFSRLYVAESDGNDLRLLLDDRMVSHYCWRDETQLLAWARTKEAGEHYYIIDVTTGQWHIFQEGQLDLYGDGHPSFSPNQRWVVTDSYPDRGRQQHLLLCNTRSGELIEIGRFFTPPKFDNEKRCDLHPRWSPDGKMLSIDASYTGERMSYILDIRSIVAS